MLDGLASFKSFLKSEFSEENLEFWMACEDFKKTTSAAKMAEKAKKIYEEFIQSEAPKEVGPEEGELVREAPSASPPEGPC